MKTKKIKENEVPLHKTNLQIGLNVKAKTKIIFRGVIIFDEGDEGVIEKTNFEDDRNDEGIVVKNKNKKESKNVDFEDHMFFIVANSFDTYFEVIQNHIFPTIQTMHPN